MSPNQIRDIIRRHEEKDNAIASRKRELSLSSKAYKLYSKFYFEYFRLTGQDELFRCMQGQKVV